MDEENKLKWSDNSHSLKDLIKSFTLPQLVMVDEGYMLNENDSLGSGQLITVQSHENVTQFKGKDSEGKAVILPIKCPFKIKLVAREDGRIYKGVGDLCSTLERPKYVEVKSCKSKRDLGLVKNGDRLKILLTERGPNGPTYLHFRNQRGKHLRLPVDFSCEFRGCAEDDNEHVLADLVSKELPLFIKFIDNQSIGDSIGIIELNECVNDTLVFASTKHQGRLFATAFPIGLDVKVRTINDAPKAKSGNEKLYDSVMQKIDVDKFRDFMARDKTIHESGYVYFAPVDVLKDKTPPAVENQETSESKITPAVVNEYEQPIQNATKRKSQGFLSRVRLKFRSNKSSNRKSKQTRPEIVIVGRESGEASDGGGESGIYEQIPADTYVSMDVIDGVRRAFNAPKKSTAKKRSVTRTQSSAVPPPLPGNHPLERRHTYNAKARNATQARTSVSSTWEDSSEKESFRKFYDNMKKSEREILNCDLDGVGRILCELKMEKYTEIFLDNQIDGKLLIDLDEAVFKDIGLTPFEARKLRKYVFGWRPDSTKANDIRSSNFAEKSEALKWSESEVADHLRNLGLHEFRRFCELNQVNGDLLWDMVVDDEIIYGLLTGADRRLNAVKLKNYVIEGWRPKMSRKRANSTNVSDKSPIKTKQDTEESSSATTTKNSGPQRKLTPSGKLDAVSVAKRRSASPTSDVMSPSSLNSERFGSEKGISRPKSRLQAKVTYPKNSPYAKSGRNTTLEDRSSEAGAAKPEKASDKNAGSLQPDKKRSVSGDKSESSKTETAKIREKTREVTGTDRKISQPGSTSRVDLKKSSVSGRKAEKQKEAAPTVHGKEAEAAKKQKPQRSFSLRGRNASTSATKNGVTNDKGKLKKDKTNEKQNAGRSLSDPKSKLVDSSKEGHATEKSGKKSVSLEKGVKKGVDERGSFSAVSVNELDAVQSPSIASLRRQYEQNEEVAFKQSEGLKRTGRNELRMAIKRKNSNSKQETKDNETKPIKSVASLKKQFDSKPIL